MHVLHTKPDQALLAVGYFVGQDPRIDVYRTSDSGLTWTEVLPESSNHFVSWSGESQIWLHVRLQRAGVSKSIWHSGNAGETWDLRQLPPDSTHVAQYDELLFTESGHGRVLQRHGDWYETTNGALTWVNTGEQRPEIAEPPPAPPAFVRVNEIGEHWILEIQTNEQWERRGEWLKMPLE
jgi:photosystem II stability/assembly factor-like uncharacterized protein